MSPIIQNSKFSGFQGHLTMPVYKSTTDLELVDTFQQQKLFEV